MKKLVISATILAFVFASAPVFAQKKTLPRPYTTKVLTKDELIKACKDEDKKLLNVSCEQYRKDVNHALEKMEVKDGEDKKVFQLKDKEVFLEYLSVLSVEKAPKEQVILGRVMPDNTTELGEFSRTPHQDEGCLFDGGHGVCIIALPCGNPYGTRVQVFRASKNQESGSDADKKLDPSELKRAIDEALNDALKRSGGAGQGQSFDQGPNWFQKNWKWALPATLGGAALVACAVTGKCFQQTVSNSTTVTVR